MRPLERVNIRTNERTYSHTYVRDRPYIPSTTLLCEGIMIKISGVIIDRWGGVQIITEYYVVLKTQIRISIACDSCHITRW